jgi:hypothetical protein
VPERLKAKVDEAAGREGLSANAWLVRVVAAAVDGTDQNTMPLPNHGRRYVGWIS